METIYPSGYMTVSLLTFVYRYMQLYSIEMLCWISWTPSVLTLMYTYKVFISTQNHWSHWSFWTILCVNKLISAPKRNVFSVLPAFLHMWRPLPAFAHVYHLLLNLRLPAALSITVCGYSANDRFKAMCLKQVRIKLVLRIHISLSIFWTCSYYDQVHDRYKNWFFIRSE